MELTGRLRTPTPVLTNTFRLDIILIEMKFFQNHLKINNLEKS